MDSPTQTAIIAGVVSLVSVIGTLAFDKGLPAILSLLNWKSGEAKVQAELAEKGYAAVIANQDETIDKLELLVSTLQTEIKQLREVERQCAIRTGILEERVKALEEWKLRHKNSDSDQLPPGSKRA